MFFQFFQRDSSIPIGQQRIKLRAIYKQTGLVAIVAAMVWWGFAYWLRLNSTAGTVWGDQAATFLSIHFQQPYQTPGLVNPPWVALFLLPLQPLSIEFAVLLQLLAYFVLLAGLVHKFSAKTPLITLLISLTSPLALDNAVELNIDWLVCLGLLVPPAFSAPLLLIKPQNALGYLLSFKWETLIQWMAGLLVTLALSFLIWGNWLAAWANRANSKLVVQAVNMAPLYWVGVVPSVLMGLGLLVAACRLPLPDAATNPKKWLWHRPDAVLSILAGLCFVPYFATYSALLPFTLIAIRYPRVALLLSVIMWGYMMALLWSYGFFAPGGVRI